MFKKCEIIYKEYNCDWNRIIFRCNANINLLIFYIVISLYIINYCLVWTLLSSRHLSEVLALRFNFSPDLVAAGGRHFLIKKEELMNPAYLIKHPFPFRYLPENNTPYYYFDTTFKTKKFLFTEGMRNDYDMYMSGNCFGEGCHAEFTANCTAKFVEGLHFLIERFEFEKLKDFDDIIFQSIDDMVKQVGLIIENDQLDLFPEIKPVYKEKLGVIEYRKIIFK